MKSVRAIRHLTNAPILVRTSLNVPIANGVVAGTYRLERAVPTISYLARKHARVIVIGHIGETGTQSLRPVYEAMRAFFPAMQFCDSVTGSEALKVVRDLPAGGIVMLENLRRERGEVMNDALFAKELAALADYFVQDSFDVCHRKHASVVGVPQLLPSYVGLSLEQELKELKRALKPKHPSLAIIGGAKFTTKEPVLVKLLNLYDHVFVGGALANDFMGELGIPMEHSLRSPEGKEGIRRLLKHPRLLLPIDEVIGPPGGNVTQSRVGVLDGKPPYEAVLDDGPETLMMLTKYIKKAKTILWNGPLGNYENGFTEGTEALARLLAHSRAHTVVGGGDTITAISKLGLNDQFSFISTGGGAMLEYLSTGTLPGVEALG